MRVPVKKKRRRRKPSALATKILDAVVDLIVAVLSGVAVGYILNWINL